MKIISFTIFLFFPLFAACNTFAGSNSLTASFPTPSGSYNAVQLTTQPGATTCNASTEGMLFTLNGTLELCAMSNNGAGAVAVQVPYGETCFNRFCSCPTAGGNCSNTTACPTSAGFTSNPNPCPTGYIQGQQNGVPINDSFTSGNAGNTYTVYSTLCCQSAIASGKPTSAVIPQ